MRIANDFWAGLAVMLVVLPASVAFGVTIYSAVGTSYAGLGALAGILGAVVLGLIAPVLGGTDRLITAPCAPATALLSAFAIGLIQQGVKADSVILLMTLLGIFSGLLQVLIGFTRVGNLIKYIPHTVVSGYMTAVGLIIIFSQFASFMGALSGTHFLTVVMHPNTWQLPAIVVGLVTALGMAFGRRWISVVPGTIVGIVLGVVAYFVMSIFMPELRTTDHNSLVLGAIDVSIDGYTDMLSERWLNMGQITLGEVAALLGSALTLAVLLSIDTLKTGIVVDQITHSRHEPNQELVAQGVANIAAGALGGIPGSGTMGPTMVNVTSGAQTLYAAMIAAGLSLIGLLLLVGFLAWLPKATLAAVLIVIGIRMIDIHALKLVTSRSTVLDFVVVMAVVIVGFFGGLIWASATGVFIAIILFLREQVGGSVVHRRSYLAQRSSSWYRSEEETLLLENKGGDAVIFELQGSLFFGTARQLYVALEAEAVKRDYVIIDLLRVGSIDVTAAHVLQQIRQLIESRHGKLIFCNVQDNHGIDIEALLVQLGVLTTESNKDSAVKRFDTLDEGIEWVENKLLNKDKKSDELAAPMKLEDIELFQGRSADTLVDLEALMEVKHFAKGVHLFDIADPGDALYLLRSGRVKMIAPIGGSRRLHHIATFGPGNFFGGLSFLDGHPRGDIALADTDVDVFILKRQSFEKLSKEHGYMAFLLMQSIALALGHRLRRTDGELTLLLE